MIAGGNHTTMYRWAANSGSEGLRGKNLRIRIGLRRIRNMSLHQSLSHATRMTAPFTQGCARRRVQSATDRRSALSAELSLRRSRAREFIDNLSGGPAGPPLCLSFCPVLTEDAGNKKDLMRNGTASGLFMLILN